MHLRRSINENASSPQLVLATTTTMSKSNKAARGGNFNRDEVDSLLDTVEEVMPIGMDEWALVERRHMASYPDRNRTKESLRRKFQLLYLLKQQTGTPECPPEVRRAKSLMHAIRDKAEVSSAGSESVVSSPELEDEVQEVQAEASNNEDSSPGSNMVETTDTSTRQQPTRGLFETPVARVGIKRKKRASDDDDDFSMKDFMKLAMMQQQQDREDSRRDREEGRKDRQMMMQMMSMAMMAMVGNNSRNSGNNDHLVQMMELSTAREQTSVHAADKSANPQPAGTVTAPNDDLDDLDVTADINIQ